LFTGGFVYLGHTAAVTCTKFSPLGTYIASGDAHGRLHLWAYDHNEHLPRLDVQVLAGPVRDVCWDRKGIRVAVCREGGVQLVELSRAIMWDTGSSAGTCRPTGGGGV
jgi:WD40 repeat protein